MTDMPHDPQGPAGESDELQEIQASIEDSRLKAAAYFREAYQHQMKGDLATAERLYRRSIDSCPTAEAYTFLAWTYSFMGRLEDAIAFCKEAIRTDPEFGNPYNDIGAYLIELGQFESAIPYFEQAMTAPRYDARHYPHFNKGRALEQMGDWQGAIAQYRAALELDPDYKVAFKAMLRLQAKLN